MRKKSSPFGEFPEKNGIFRPEGRRGGIKKGKTPRLSLGSHNRRRKNCKFTRFRKKYRRNMKKFIKPLAKSGKMVYNIQYIEPGGH